MKELRTPDDCTLVFDLGRVLVDFDETLLVRRVIDAVRAGDPSRPVRLSPEDLYRMVFRTELLHEFERGRMGPRRFFGEIARRFDLRIPYEDFVAYWSDIFTEKSDTVALVDRLKARGYPLFILSNIDCLHHDQIRRKYRILDRFDRLFLSYEVGYAKPDPEIYRCVIEASGRPARDVFFVDDRPDLVESAQAQGMHAVVFSDAGQLEADLADFGVGGPDARGGGE